MLVKINGIPAICKHIVDQTKCEEIVSVCGPDSLPDVCAAKYLFLNLTYGGRWDSPLIFVKSIHNAYFRSMEFVFDKTMQGGHDYLHSLVDATIRNIGG